MSTQPDALRLADLLDSAPYSSPLTNDAAEELRRLDAVNAELLGALKLSVTTMRGLGVDELDGAFLQAQVAIAMSTGETK